MKKTDDDRQTIIGACVAVAFALVVFGFLWSGYSECNDQGGQYVRGLFWMECVK